MPSVFKGCVARPDGYLSLSMTRDALVGSSLEREDPITSRV